MCYLYYEITWQWLQNKALNVNGKKTDTSYVLRELDLRRIVKWIILCALGRRPYGGIF